MISFDAIKALREELTGLSEIISTIRRREQKAEADIAEAESELNSIRKLRGYAQIKADEIRERIRKLENEARDS